MKPTGLQVIVSDYMGSTLVDLGQSDPEISLKSNKSSRVANTLGTPGTRSHAPLFPWRRLGSPPWSRNPRL